jgi:lipoic acid synthetase
VVTIGQYLQPTQKHLNISHFVPPEKFQHFKEVGMEMGFDFVESGPLVRSSYHAERHVYPNTQKKQYLNADQLVNS